MQIKSLRLITTYKAVQFPACVTDLNAGLSNMHRNTFSLWKIRQKETKQFHVILVYPIIFVDLCHFAESYFLFPEWIVNIIPKV